VTCARQEKGKMEILIGITIWVIIFIIWYCRTYPEKVRNILPVRGFDLGKLRKPKVPNPKITPIRRSVGDFKSLVETVESICAKDSFGSSDAATMVEAVKRLNTIEPSSGQIWEAYALDSLESAAITCDDCHIPVEKTIKKTGVRIQCRGCGKWLALKNSKVTVIDPSRPDLEDWEK
jgi:hypothetical protein